MSARVIGAILRKDLRAFSRDRFFVLITVLGLVAYTVMFWLLPDKVDETIRLGVYPGDLPALPGVVADDEGPGLSITEYPSPEALATAVDEGQDDIIAGVAFPDDFLQTTLTGGTPTVRLLVPAAVPPEQVALIQGLVSEVAFVIAGRDTPVNTTTTVLGVDRVGNQISLQQQMRPLLAFFILMVETFALASLVAIEVQERTVTAVLVTPAQTSDFIGAKGVLGTSLAFIEVTLLMLLIGGFSTNAGALLVALLLGAMLVTGFGMVAGSLGRDFLGVLFISLLFMIPLTIPAFGALFPGSTAGWIKALPTYGLVETIIRVTVDGDTLLQVAPVLLVLAGWTALAFLGGALILRRRVATL